MMATLPGLPMFGHGQLEGYTERYGMEYRRAYHEEQPDTWLVARHEREISPLLHRRYLFAEVNNFLLYDFFTDHGRVNEDVFAYSNRSGDERALVVFNNRYASTRGWIRTSSAFAEKTAHGKHLRQSTLGESFGFRHASPVFAAYRDALSGLEYLHRARDLAERGLPVELHAYQTLVLLDWRDLHENAARPWGRLCDSLAGRGVPSLEDALKTLLLQPVHEALRAVMDPALAEALATGRLAPGSDGSFDLLETAKHRAGHLLAEVDRYLGERSNAAERARAAELFVDRLHAALKLDTVYKAAGTPWPLAVHGMPAQDGRKPADGTKSSWVAVLGWCALEAIGEIGEIGAMRDPANPDAAAAELFDALRLRGPVAAAFAAQGLTGDEEWRAAARLRAAFAYSSRNTAAGRWVHDPDVAWAVGVHEHEGVSYLVKEHLERLLWWMALRDLLDVAGATQFEPDRLKWIEEAIKERVNAAERAGYRVETLEAMTLFDAPREPEESLQKRP
jgi:hypothetical protein